MEPLQVMQNKAARLVKHSQLRASRQAIFSQVRWMTVNPLVFSFSALSTFRIRQNKEPQYLSNIMARDNIAGRIIVPNTDVTLAKNNFCPGLNKWSTLPEHIRTCQIISQIKSQMKRWILENVPQFVGT